MKITEYVPNIPAGTYDAVVTGLEEKVSKKDGSLYRRWEFSLADGSGRTIGAISSMQTTPNSKAGKWLASMIGRVPNVGEDIDPIGLRCTLGIVINDRGFEEISGILAPSAGNRPNAVHAPVPTPSPVVAAGSDDLPF